MTHGAPAGSRRKNNTNNGVNGDIVAYNNDDDNDYDQLPTPPDGGWGWVVAFASFMIHIVTDGITYSFGMFYVEFLLYFNEGKGYTSLILSILVGVTLCSGPISSSFVNRYGCRAVTIAGAILASICMIISMFAKNVLTLIFTIGIGTGLGFGLIYLPAIVSVTTYFEKYRSLATGIAVCGSGLGTFIFAPLSENLINNYGWRGACLILAGIVLNCIIFGAMFRPLESPKPPSQRQIPLQQQQEQQHSSNNYVAELQPLQKKYSNTNNLEIQKKSDSPITRAHSIGYDLATNGNYTSANNSNGKISNKSPPASHNIMRATVSQPHIHLDNNESYYRERKTQRAGSGYMYRPDILYQGSLMNIAEYRKSKADLSTKGELTHYGSLRRSKPAILADEEKVEHLLGCAACSQETRDTFKEMMDFSLFRDIIFILFVLSNFCTSIGFNIPYVYLAAQAEFLNLSSEQGSYLISIIGIANTVGRIILGYISDKPWVNRLLVYNICLTICGLATTFSVFCVTFNTLAFYASVFGFTIGAYVGLTSVILVDLLGLDKLTNAFGLLLLFQGIASLVGPPFAGWLYDITESYNPGFILAGGFITISGIMLFLIPPIQRYLDKKRSTNQSRSRSNSTSSGRLAVSAS
ncbi:monocarboxylate transporter 14 [Condylostylus longicornis]|uniref:monocarboxylate transporter 14 n=1 Tax=Condylostylus longicornis TaxID=2530218 RepID=UPI00244E05E7|nr:monocarboxylate transporter 14 [Condylostylus longicornis]XP_055371141.1 monocarboxylate transporter 14 [Condylostylus longicornis]